LRCYFDDYEHLPEEATAYILTVLLKEPGMKDLPMFIFGISMGGCTAVRMAQLEPELYRGVVLYAPMLSLEQIEKQRLFACIRNKDLAPCVTCLDCCCPTSAIGKAAKNIVHPLSQQEQDEDELSYSGDVRVRVAAGFGNVTRWLLKEGGMRNMRTPFVTFHSVRDTFTDPLGSELLVREADVEDKTYVKIGKDQDIIADMWHSLTTEPGAELVFERALLWITERSE